jgi:tetratricopeptide (TPR) repeat protein
MSHTANPLLRLTTLGSASLAMGDVAVPLPAKAIVLLAILAKSQHRRCTRDYAISLLWPHSDEERARHSLNQMLHLIKSLIGQLVVATKSDDLILTQEIKFDIVDVKNALSRRNVLEALELYHGAFLESTTIEGSLFEDWRSTQQHALVEEIEHAVAAKVEALFFTGNTRKCGELIEKASGRLGDYWDNSVIDPAIILAFSKETVRAVPSVALIAREAEMAVLCQAHNALKAGIGSIVTVSGESGYGKTVLVGSFLLAAQRCGTSAVTLRGYEPLRTVGFNALRELIKDERLYQNLRGLSNSHQSFLQAAIGNVTSDIPLDAEKKHFVFDAAARLIENTSRDAPLIVCFDDLHWFDQSSVEFIEYLARRASRIPILLIVSLRPGKPKHADGIANGSFGPVIHLGAFGTGEIERHTREVVGTRRAKTISRAVVRRTAGHPYLVGEVIKAVAATREWSASAINEASTPSVQAFVARQTGELSANARFLLQALATLARPTAHRVVRRILGLNLLEFLRALQELIDLELVAGKRSSLNCVHDLVRESVYTSMTPVQRLLLHKRCATALGASGSDALYHLQCARDRKRSYICALREIRRASSIAAAKESDYCYRVAIASARSTQKKALLMFRRAHNAFALGQLRTAKRLFTALATERHPILEKKLAEVEFYALDIERELGTASPVELSRRAKVIIAAAATGLDLSTEVHSLILLGRVHLLDGYANEKEVCAVIERLVKIARDYPNSEVAVFGLTWAVGALVFLGRPAEAEHLADELLPDEEANHHTAATANVHACQAILYSHNGRINDAIERSRSAIANAEAHGLWRLRKNILANLSGVLIEAAQYDAATAVLSELVRTSDVDQALPHRALAHTNFALLSLSQHNLEKARYHALRGLEIAGRLQKPWPVAFASAILGLIAIEQGSIADAKMYRERVLQMAGTYFGNDELPMAQLVSALAEIENERSTAIAWLEALISNPKISSVCRASLEVELARLLIRDDRERSASILERVRSFARSRGAIRLYESAENVFARLELAKQRSGPEGARKPRKQSSFAISSPTQVVT